MQSAAPFEDAAGGGCARLLGIDVVEHMCQAKALEHQVPARLQQLSNNSVWLGQVPLKKQHPPPILCTDMLKVMFLVSLSPQVA